MNNIVQTEMSDVKKDVAKNRESNGFTLLEVVLAILVVAVGLLAVFGLITFGLDASEKAVGDTLAGIFADDVFNGLRSYSIAAADQGNWGNFWSAFAGGSTSVTFAAWRTWDGTLEKKGALSDSTWSSDGPVYIKCSVAGAAAYKATLVCKSFVGRPISTPNLVNHTIRYSLNAKAASGGKQWYEVTLKVWPGEFGSMVVQKPITFYSEFGNPGNM